MPTYERTLESIPSPAPIVVPSAAAELFWLTFWATEAAAGGTRHKELNEDHPARPHVPALEAAVGDFWQDEERCFTELIALADLAGGLLDPDPDVLLAGLPRLLKDVEVPTFELETPEIREILRARIRRLRAEPALRRRYVAALSRAWAVVREDWDARGRAHVTAFAESAAARLRGGARAWDVMPKFPERFDAAVEGAAATGSVIILPAYFGGHWMIVDLPGRVAVSFRPEATGAAERRRLEGLAGRVKALSDPTRLAILAQLGRQPSTITDIARRFEISQPGVSAQFKVLRDAGLVTGERRDGRTLYSVDRPALQALLDEAGSGILPA